MSAFRGRERNKGVFRRNAKAAEYFKKLVARQDANLVEQIKRTNGNKINTEIESTTPNL